MIKHILIIAGGVVLYIILAVLQLLILNLLGMMGDTFILLALAVSFAITIFVALIADSWT